MLQPNHSINILVAEDDDDHYFLVEKILKESSFVVADLHRVADGEELMDYLLQQGRFGGALTPPRPSLVLLDINMPKKDGWEALKEIKSHPHLRQIPVVVMSTSDIEEDKFRGYDLGANSYIRKPIEFKEWVETIHVFNRYWFGIVDLPNSTARSL